MFFAATKDKRWHPWQQNLEEVERLAVDVVCVSDSITGWNDFVPARSCPYPTYPHFLQQLCETLGLRVADGGIAGEISDNGLGHVRRYLPNPRYFIIGFGTNDLGTWPDLESTSERIIGNLGRMMDAVRDRERLPILFNVPYANESLFPKETADDTHCRRDHHNERLMAFCEEQSIPLADICFRLRDEHLGDELHPNEDGAKIIAEVVYEVLSAIHNAEPL